MAARRTAALCLALVTMATAADPADAAALRDSYLIAEGGQIMEFEVAADEVQVTPPNGAGSSLLIPVQPSADRVRIEADRIAAQTGAEADLVVYPKGAQKTEFSKRIVTKSVLVKLHPGTDADALAASVNAVASAEIYYAPGFRTFTGTGAGAALRIAEELTGKPGVASAMPMLATWKQPHFTPNDPLFTNQWHLLNTGQSNAAAGIDINVTNVWETYTGRGVTISVVDTGVQVGHPDLLANVNTLIDYDYNFNDSDPSPSQGVTDAHGTSVAGVAAGAGNNGIGISGVAFNSSIVGLRFLSGATPDSTTAAVLLHSNQVVHVSNNSWGPVLFGLLLGGPGTLAEAALAEGTSNGRNGLGSIFVFSAGNGDLDFENVNYNGFANSIHTIAVGALGNRGEKADYSNRGAALVISAPSGGEVSLGGRAHATTTTDTVGAAGFNNGSGGDLADADYTEIFNGTSSAAPVVSGVVSLMLEANPNLGWRDVQEILIRSAFQTDFFDSDWIQNGAGFHFNHKYGAGRVDAEAAVAMAQTWTNLAEQVVITAVQTNLNLAVPDLSPTGVSVNFDISATDFRTEHVVVAIDTTHSFAGDLEIKLTSPDGTESRLAERDYTPLFDYNGWRLMTVRNWGESAQGTWTLKVADRGFGGTGTLDYARLEVWGSSTNAIPDLSISDARIQEGDQGTTNAVFNVSLSQPVSGFLNVSYATGGGTATPGVDYTATAGSLIFTPGETNLTISVPIRGDLLEEPNETFYVSIFNSTEVQIVDASGLGEILNDDGPVWTVEDASALEMDAGTNTLVFNLSISEVSSNAVSVVWYTQDGTATAGLDYGATNGIVTLAPGVTNETVTVEIYGDAILETNEFFTLQLTNATFSSVLDDAAIGTILDDEPRIVLQALSVLEGNEGFHDVVVDVSLTKPGLLDIAVDYATTNLTAKAGASLDYLATNGTLSFFPGVTNQIITLRVNGDQLYERDETLAVRLTNPTNAAIVTELNTITILDDDPAPQLSVVDGAGPEGDSGTNSVAMTVTLNVPSGLPAVVDYITGVGTASVGVDYQANSGTLIFQPGVTERTVNVGVFGDTNHEQDETFMFTLRNEQNATIERAVGIGLISNDDAAPALSIADVAITEGDSGTTTATLTVSVDTLSGMPITADYATSDASPAAGAATAGSDYTPAGGSITIPVGSTSATVSIEIAGDSLNEDNETFSVTLSNPGNATIADAVADVTIVNDDGPILSISDVTVTEGDSGTTEAVLTVTLSEISLDTVTVSFMAVDGTATMADNDYSVLTSSPLNFFSSETTKTITNLITGDLNLESAETFEIVLMNPVSATISDSRGLVTIEDDDTKADLAVTVDTDPASAFLTHDLTYRVAVTNNSVNGATNVLVTCVLPQDADLISVSPAALSTNMDGSLTFNIGELPAGAATNAVFVTMRPNALATLDFSATVDSDQPDDDTGNNTAASSLAVGVPTVVVDTGFDFTLVSESRIPANGALDPGETVTVALTLRNTGTVASTNVMATLRAEGGVLSPSLPQQYGAIPASGTVTRSFTFTADPAASGDITASVDLVDLTTPGANDMGLVTATFGLPAIQGQANTAAIAVPDQGSASVSDIVVSDMADAVINTVTVTLHGLSHTFPADLDILLVGPNNVGVVLMSDAGRDHDLAAVDLTFADAATAKLPRLDAIATGTYQPTDHVENQADSYPAAPAAPYATALSAFSGISPNGTWSLYVVDDAVDDMGALAGGWSLSFDTIRPLGSSAGLSVAVSADKQTPLFGDTVTYTITVRNEGPGAASNVRLTGDFADGLAIQQVNEPMGAVATSTVDPIVIDLGSMVNPQSATVTVTARVDSVGALASVFTVAGDELDLNPANNTATVVTLATRPLMLSAAFVNESPGDGFRIMVQGEDEATYSVEVSSDLITWTSVATVRPVGGQIDFSDTNVSGADYRFYRVVKR